MTKMWWTAAGGVSVVLIAIAVWANFSVPGFVSLEDCATRPDLAGDVVKSMRDTPDEWSSDSYYLRHESGLSFWLGPQPSFTAPVGDKDHDNWETGPGLGTSAQRCVVASYKAWRVHRQYEPRLSANRG